MGTSKALSALPCMVWMKLTQLLPVVHSGAPAGGLGTGSELQLEVVLPVLQGANTLHQESSLSPVRSEYVKKEHFIFTQTKERAEGTSAARAMFMPQLAPFSLNSYHTKRPYSTSRKAQDSLLFGDYIF